MCKRLDLIPSDASLVGKIYLLWFLGHIFKSSCWIAFCVFSSHYLLIGSCWNVLWREGSGARLRGRLKQLIQSWTVFTKCSLSSQDLVCVVENPVTKRGMPRMPRSSLCTLGRQSRAAKSIFSSSQTKSHCLSSVCWKQDLCSVSCVALELMCIWFYFVQTVLLFALFLNYFFMSFRGVND